MKNFVHDKRKVSTKVVLVHRPVFEALFLNNDERESRWSRTSPTIEDPTLIVCPRCTKKAKVIPISDHTYRAACAYCGFTEEHPENNHGFYWQDDNPTDGYFGYDLWLKTTCCGYSFWAFNVRHLDLLESYIGAKLRERTKDEKWGWQNSSLISRLPKWLKSTKNRDEILRSIKYLRKMV